MPRHEQKTKIGPAHGVPHRKVWIEGRHLKEAGFSPGDRYDRVETTTGLVLIHCLSGTGKYKVAGKGEKPVIDISGSIVPKLFPPPATHVTVAFNERNITLTRCAS